jgi:hypothetical protein
LVSTMDVIVATSAKTVLAPVAIDGESVRRTTLRTTLVFEELRSLRHQP